MQNIDPNILFFFNFTLLLVIAGFSAYYAETKGRSPAAWFAITLLISIFAPIILFFLPSLKEKDSATRFDQPPPPPKQVNKYDEENSLWYYLDASHHQYGPVSIVALRELWNTGRLNVNSYVWTATMSQWEKVDNLPELKNVLNQTPSDLPF